MSDPLSPVSEMRHLTDEHLQRYRQGQMQAEDLRAADAHLAACAHCRARLLSAGQLRRAANSLVSALRFESTESNCLDYERLVAYVDDRLDPFERDLAESHLKLCELCSEDVRSLQRFKGMVGSIPASYAPSKKNPLASVVKSWRAMWQPRYLLAPATALAVALIVISIQQMNVLHSLSKRVHELETEARQARQESDQRTAQILLGIRKQSETLQRRIAAVEAEARSVRQPTAVANENPPQSRVTQIAKSGSDTNGERDGVRSLQKLADELLSKGKVTQPREIALVMADLRTDMVLRSGSSAQTSEPAPLSPVATAIRTLHPRFTWKSVPEAEEYRVVIANASATEIIWQGSAGKATAVTMPRETRLAPGKTYSWQVEANVNGEPRISSWTKFHLLSEKAQKHVALMERKAGGAALLLTALYEAYGLYNEAQTQVERLPAKVQSSLVRLRKKP